MKYITLIVILTMSININGAQTDLRKDTVGDWVSTDNDSLSISKIYRVGVSALLINNKIEDLGGLNLVSEVRARAAINGVNYTLYEMFGTKQVLFESKDRVFVGNFLRSNDTLRFDNKTFIKK